MCEEMNVGVVCPNKQGNMAMVTEDSEEPE